MSGDPEFGTILDVLPDGTCNVQTDYDAVHVAVVFATGYTPGQGDRVLLDFVGGSAVIVGAQGVARPRVPTFTVQDTPPSGDRYRQFGAVWQDTTAGDAVPALIGVRASPPTPPTSAPAGPVAPSTSGTWDDFSHWQYGDVIQGQDRSYQHPRTGLWLYPSLVDGRTALGLSIHVARHVGSGPGGNVSLRFYLHGETGAPSAMPTLYESFDGGGALTLSPGAADDFTLPASWAVLLAAGTRKGVAISSTSFADYGRCDGAAPLTFTFAT